MRHRLAALVGLAPTLLAPTFAGAADLDVASRIDRVTVFPDAAVVTRIATVELPAGASTLTLRGLPAAIDPASLRVEGQGSAPFVIGAVDTRAAPGEAQPVIDADLERRIRALREEREMVGGRIGAAQGKKAAIERFAQAGPEKLSAEAKPLAIGEWQAAWDAIGTGLAAVNEELRSLNARARDLDGEIAALERARPQPPRPGAPKRDVVIAVDASSALTGDVRVSYRVAGAAWVPAYDARLDTGAADRTPALELIRRARVSQRTGEDWRDVALTVSTVRVRRGTAAPDLPPLQVQFRERPLPYGAARSAAPMAAPPEPSEPRGEDRTKEATVAATEQAATLEVGAFQASFTVPGRVSLAPDGSAKSFVLGTRQVAPELVVKVVPVVDETAYLEASFTNEDEAALLPGEVFLHRDGMFVGRGRIALVAAGERVDLGFGADDRVKVTRVPLSRRESEPGWIGQTRSDLREFKTSVKNLHARPMRITIVDRLPFSENASITVDQLKETTPPTEAQLADKRGVVAWTFDYAPGEARDIRLAYRLRWPADRDITLEPKPRHRPGS